MKSLRLLFFAFFFTLSFTSNAQVYRFKASSYSVLEMRPNGRWGEWSDAVQSNVVITLDGKKDRIIIDSNEQQLYKIEAYREKISNDTDDILSFDCRDNEGSVCTIQIITRKNQGNRKQLYVNFRDLKIVYNIYD